MTSIENRLARLTPAQMDRLVDLIQEQAMRVSSEELTGEVSNSGTGILPDRTQLVAYFTSADGQSVTAELRELSAQKLPDFMRPAIYVQVDTIPKLHNGKTDYAQLPDPDPRDSQSMSRATDIDQVTINDRESIEVANKLIALLGELIGMTDIRPSDNFFEIGGDSIIAIQLVSRARECGLALSIADITSSSDFQSLASSIGHSSQSLVRSTIPAYGPTPLTPIQSWFFSHRHPYPELWNLGGLVDFTVPMNTSAVTKAIVACVNAHPVLSSRFTQESGRWTSHLVDEAPPQTLVRVVSHQEWQGEQPSPDLLRRVHNELSLGSGWLLRFIVLEDGMEADGRGRAEKMWWSIHHLICDGLSTQILLDGIKTRCMQVAADDAKSEDNVQPSSFRQWALALQTLRAEKLPNDEGGDAPGEKATGIVNKTLPRECDCADIQALIPTTLVSGLLSANAAYSTHTHELVLVAVAFAWCRLLQYKPQTMDVETHGRNALGSEIDTSGVMGWYTTYFPLSLSSMGECDIDQGIKFVKESYRHTQQQDQDYLLKRYGDQPTVPEIDLLDPGVPNFLFNFINTTTIGSDSTTASIWRSSMASIELLRAPENHRSHIVELNVHASRDSIVLKSRYVPDVVNASQMSLFNRYVHEELKRIVDYCNAKGTTAYTPSDFPDLQLDQEDLDSLLDQLGNN